MQDTTSDSDYADCDSNYGPTTRRAWSDWCSNKGKSSQSEEESNSKVCAYRTAFGDGFNTVTLKWDSCIVFFSKLIINTVQGSHENTINTISSVGCGNHILK